MENRRKIVNNLNDITEKYFFLKKIFLSGCEIFKNDTLSNYCSFGIGGPADFIVKIHNEKSLITFLKYANSNFYVLGKGTNVLFSDEGYRGIIVLLTGEFKKIKILNDKILCGSGALLSEVLNFSIKNNLQGLEFCNGIPGTVGGAVYGNSGTRNIWLSSVIENIDIYKKNEKIHLNRKKIPFNYRYSGLNNCIISDVVFSLKKSNSNKNNKTLEVVNSTNYRLYSQPIFMPNAGSIFKNPNNMNVGKLIESMNLKGKRIGGAQISELHGNFIVNTGKASSKDVMLLINLIKKKARKQFNINLELEINIF
ncbi:MAG: UDP-N-acetylmuramate dehydrogenase [Endomicrobium sp.]|jgi:UDP-N-acetylmuramate dehydrogenase|nr:UDP-N-acetylmuramate dehydrogenase [Endomicrobium sp.]